jgi:hypothetical protein
MKAKSGGGITSNKLVRPSVRTGTPSKQTSPGAADQIGAAVAFKREQVDFGPAYNSGVKLGNEVALNVSGGGPGKGREVHKCGSQNQWGPPNRGESPRSEPRGFDVRGRLKGDVWAKGER